MPSRERVAVGVIGPDLDRGDPADRWESWRPSVALCLQPDLPIDRFHLIHEPRFRPLAATVADDIRQRSPGTRVVLEEIPLSDPWDLAEVYAAFYAFAERQAFNPAAVELYVHTTTGPHVMQICLFLLTRSRDLPGMLVQTYPAATGGEIVTGRLRVIDLDLSRYDALSALFRTRRQEGATRLKAGMKTRNPAFNRLVEEIENVAVRSTDPILLLGPTGTGKTVLARRIFERKREVQRLTGTLVELNCATMRGDLAKSELFGHRRGSFTGASRDKPGALARADRGVLFLDEVGDLGLEEQTMLLKALDERRFLPVGAERDVESRFQLIAATNRDLPADVAAHRFREDLYARISIEVFRLPPLAERREDIEPFLEAELAAIGEERDLRYRFEAGARAEFLRFALSPAAGWSANLRDLQSAIRRMANRAEQGRITSAIVGEEIRRLDHSWSRTSPPATGDLLAAHLTPARAAALDHFDAIQLAAVLQVCSRSRSLSEAGRRLFQVSRERKATVNDADRLRKYLQRFGVDPTGVCRESVD